MERKSWGHFAMFCPLEVHQIGHFIMFWPLKGNPGGTLNHVFCIGRAPQRAFYHVVSTEEPPRRHFQHVSKQPDSTTGCTVAEIVHWLTSFGMWLSYWGASKCQNCYLPVGFMKEWKWRRDERVSLWSNLNIFHFFSKNIYNHGSLIWSTDMSQQETCTLSRVWNCITLNQMTQCNPFLQKPQRYCK